MRISAAKVDSKKIEAPEGQWVENIPELQGVRIKTRGFANKSWRKLQKTLTDAVPRNRRVNGLQPDDQDRLMGTCLRDAAVTDWDGIENDDGTPMPFNKENATKLFLDPDYQKFRDGALWAAQMVGEQTIEEDEEDAKNS